MVRIATRAISNERFEPMKNTLNSSSIHYMQNTLTLDSEINLKSSVMVKLLKTEKTSRRHREKTLSVELSLSMRHDRKEERHRGERNDLRTLL